MINRIIINNGLNDSLSFKTIARTIRKTVLPFLKKSEKNSVHRDVSAPASSIISVLLVAYPDLRFVAHASSVAVNVIILLKMSVLASLNLPMSVTAAQIKTNVLFQKNYILPLRPIKAITTGLLTQEKEL